MTPWRRRAVRALFVAVVVGHVAAFLANREAPNHVYAYQMFDEASTWQADVVRVTSSGERIPIEEPWAGYRWDDLVPDRGLSRPDVLHHADSGMETTLHLLDGAIDWVAANTPRDTDTRYLEARVVWYRNGGEARRTVLRSPLRQTP